MTSTSDDLRSDVETTRAAMNDLLISLRATGCIEDESAASASDHTFPTRPSTTRCTHDSAVPVRSVVDDALLAALCPDCGEQLPAEWLTCEHLYESGVDITGLGEIPGRRSCNECGVTYWPPPHRPSTDTHDGEAKP